MKTKVSLFVLVIAVSLLLQFCENPLEPDEVKTINGITFQLVVDKKEYHLPDLINIKIVVTNLSGANKTFHFSTGCQFAFRIKLSDETIFDNPYVCPLVLTSITVNAGETKNELSLKGSC